MDPKDINRTNFCNKSVDNIVSNDMKKYIIEDMKLKTSLTPSSRYAKIFNAQYSKNLNNPHIFCLKTYGSPYLLYLTKINNVNYTLLIDKKIKTGHDYPKMFIVQYRFNDDLYYGTLFETELLRDDDNGWQLLLGDIYYHKGKMLKDKVITDRIDIMHDMLKDEYIDDSFCDICPLMIKRYFDMNDKEKAFNEFIPELNYKIRGLYFVPINVRYSNILYMFKDDELKNLFVTKDNNKRLNFKITKSMKPEIYELHLNDKDTLKQVCYAYIKNIEMSQYIYDLLIDDEDIIMECEYNDRFKKWEPIKKTLQRIHHINDLEIL
jgi:hypothetical protein